MLRKKTNQKEINKKEVNDVITLGKKILQILYVLAFIACIYIITIVCKEWKIVNFLITLFKIVLPLFIGIGIAWLFDPIVKWLNKKGVRRSLGTLVTYIILLGIIAIILGSIVPLLIEQINEFAKSVPSIVESVKVWIQNIFSSFEYIEGFNVKSFEKEVFTKIGQFGTSLTSKLPEMSISLVKTFISGMGTILVGMIIGFYLLISFDNVNDTIITIIPKKFQKTLTELINKSNLSLRKWVRGTILDATLIFVVTSLALFLVGLKAPLLFGLFCGITNIIPYAGPYIGGIPAAIVAFSQSTTTGVLTIVCIFVIQLIEGNFFQPLIMSKTTKLHPVTIMLGLLIFGHFFGIIGMVISTPIISICKVILEYAEEKYKTFHIENEDEEK